MTLGIRVARVIALCVLIAGIVAAVLLRRSGVEWSVEALRTWVDAQALAPLVFVLIFAVRSFLAIPSVLMMATGGVLFGLAGGTLWGTLGATANAIMMYWMARLLGREFVAKRLKGKMLLVDQHLRHHGPYWLAAYSAVPVSLLSIGHLAAGLSSVGFIGFTIACLVGLIPRALLYSYLGDSIAGGNWVGVAAVTVFVVIVALVVYRFRRYRPSALNTPPVLPGDSR